MALMACRECGGPVSEKALVCPHCGYELKQPKSVAGSIVKGIIGTIILIFIAAYLYLDFWQWVNH